MEVAMEDDVFFADLNRQISLLITEDDDNDEVDAHLAAAVAHYPSLMSLQTNWPPATLLQQHQNDNRHRRQMLPHQTLLYSPDDCRREIRGTGVFIPRRSSSSSTPQPRRKGKQQGGSFRRASAKQQFVGSSTRSVAAAAYAANNSHSSYNYNVNRF